MMLRIACWGGMLAVALALAPSWATGVSVAEEKPAGEFARSTIDLGVVVSDIDRAVKFYTEAIGFKQSGAFKVAGDFASDAGLTNGAPLDIRVLTLGDGEEATKIKLMQVAGVKAKKSDEKHIHSTLGFSYLTIFVNDMNAATKRLEAAGARPIAKGPVEIPRKIAAGMYLTVVRDPDGNLIELVGPKGK